MPIPARPALARTRANRAVPESIGGGDRRPITRDQADQTDVRRHTLGISPTWGICHKKGTCYWPVHLLTVYTGCIAGSTHRRDRRCGHHRRPPLCFFFGSGGRPGLLTPSPNLSFTNWKNCRGRSTAAADRFTHSVRSRAGTAFSTASTNSAVARYFNAPNILTSSANRSNSRYRFSRPPLSPFLTL